MGGAIGEEHLRACPNAGNRFANFFSRVDVCEHQKHRNGPGGEVSREQDRRRRIGARSREMACLDQCYTSPIAASSLHTERSMRPNNLRMLDSRKAGLI